MNDPLAWLLDCVDVPLECSKCGMMTSLGGFIAPDIDINNEEEVLADLCDCDAPFKIYVSDAPKELVAKLAELLDTMEVLGFGTPKEES